MLVVIIIELVSGCLTNNFAVIMLVVIYSNIISYWYFHLLSLYVDWDHQCHSNQIEIKAWTVSSHLWKWQVWSYKDIAESAETKLIYIIDMLILICWYWYRNIVMKICMMRICAIKMSWRGISDGFVNPQISCDPLDKTVNLTLNLKVSILQIIFITIISTTTITISSTVFTF